MTSVLKCDCIENGKRCKFKVYLENKCQKHYANYKQASEYLSLIDQSDRSGQSSPKKTTPVKSSPDKCSPVKVVSVKCTPDKTTPVKPSSIKTTPVKPRTRGKMVILPGKVQCACMTIYKKQCSYPALPGSEYCGRHQKCKIKFSPVPLGPTKTHSPSLKKTPDKSILKPRDSSIDKIVEEVMKDVDTILKSGPKENKEQEVTVVVEKTKDGDESIEITSSREEESGDEEGTEESETEEGTNSRDNEGSSSHGSEGMEESDGSDGTEEAEESGDPSDASDGTEGFEASEGSEASERIVRSVTVSPEKIKTPSPKKVTIRIPTPKETKTPKKPTPRPPTPRPKPRTPSPKKPSPKKPSSKKPTPKKPTRIDTPRPSQKGAQKGSPKKVAEPRLNKKERKRLAAIERAKAEELKRITLASVDQVPIIVSSGPAVPTVPTVTEVKVVPVAEVVPVVPVPPKQPTPPKQKTPPKEPPTVVPVQIPVTLPPAPTPGGVKPYVIKDFIGHRPTMEDRHSILIGDRYEFYAVYDGHNGYQAAGLVKRLMEENVGMFINGIEPFDWAGFLQDTYYVVDDALKTILPDKSGTTMLGIVWDKGDELVDIINVGDSRCHLIGYNNKPVLITKDHSVTSDTTDVTELLNRGADIHNGYIFIPSGEFINVTRSFGDFQFEPFILKRPDITEFSTKGVSKILLTSDGIWDNGSGSEAGVKQILDIPADPQVWIEDIVYRSYFEGSGDNLTAILVLLDRQT